MSLTSLSSAQLRQLLQLIKEKEAIQTKLAKVDRSLKALESGTKPQKIRSVSIRSRRRVGLKDAIIKKLQTAGRDGMKVKDLANSIGAKLGSVSVWFYTTGKTVKGIQKVGKSKFSYRP